MLGNLSKSLEDRSKISRMPIVAEASQSLRETAGPGPLGDTVKQAITRAADAVNFVLRAQGLREISYGRAENIWRREARRIDAHEIDAIRIARARALDERENGGLRAELREASALADRLERLAARAVPLTDPALDAEIRAQAHQARRTARALRGLAGSGS